MTSIVKEMNILVGLQENLCIHIKMNKLILLSAYATLFLGLFPAIQVMCKLLPFTNSLVQMIHFIVRNKIQWTIIDGHFNC